MGWNFSALMRYQGPTTQVVTAITRLESENVYLPLHPVLEYGIAQGYGFACPDANKDAPAWREFPDWESLLARRPELPCLKAWLELPSDFLLMFGPDAIWVQHSVRWQIFVTDTGWQAVLLEAARHFANVFEASECIVTRDEHPAIQGFHDGASFSDAIRAASQLGEGEVPRIEDLFIDQGVADDLVHAGPDGDEPVPIWDSRGYLRLTV